MSLIRSIKNKFLALGSLGVVGAGLMPVAYAEESSNPFEVSVTDNTAADNVVRAIVGVVASIFRYIGIILLAWGIGMLVLAFKNEDADSKTKAIMLIIVSIVLIALKTFLNTVLGIAWSQAK